MKQKYNISLVMFAEDPQSLAIALEMALGEKFGEDFVHGSVNRFARAADNTLKNVRVLIKTNPGHIGDKK